MRLIDIGKFEIDVTFDVLTRWSYEKQGIPVRRELPNTYLWFTGDGEQNHFREEW